MLELTRRYGGAASLVQCGDIVIHVTVYLATLIFCIIVEICIAYVSTQGSIRRTEPREALAYFLYIRIGKVTLIVCLVICNCLYCNL